METNAHDERAAHGTNEAANLGVVRPPLVYLASILTGASFEYGWSLPFVPPAFTALLGSLLVIGALVLFFCATGTFRAAGTPVPGNKPTTVIVRTGPYRFSRNPIYVAFTLLQLGVAVWVNSLWLIVTLIAAVALMSLIVIPREERYLERRFGAEYVDYRASVRRWL